MNPQDPLVNLHPLREPEAIGWWPLAPGWWLLIILSVIAVAALSYWLYRRHQAKAYRRQALRQLEVLQQQRQAGLQDTDYLESINALLKRVAIIAYPERAVAALHSVQWLDFLNSSTKSSANGKELFAPDFATAVYEKSSGCRDPDQIHRAAQHWIKYHGEAV